MHTKSNLKQPNDGNSDNANRHVVLSDSTTHSFDDLNQHMKHTHTTSYDERGVAHDSPQVSSSFYYDIATPKSPHDDTLLAYEMDEEENQSQKEAMRSVDKEVIFQKSKKDILNNIHLFMLMKFKENKKFRQDLSDIEKDLDLLKSIHAMGNIYKDTDVSFNNNKRTAGILSNDNVEKKGEVREAGQEQDNKKRKIQTHIPSNQHHKRNYTDTCPTRNSGIIGLNDNGVSIFKRFDGVLIIIKCETCGKEGFTSPQGIVNHARLKHSKLYSSQPKAILNNQVLVKTQSNKILQKFQELQLDPLKDFLPHVAITLVQLSPRDSALQLDDKIMLVSEKSSTSTPHVSATIATPSQKKPSPDSKKKYPLKHLSKLEKDVATMKESSPKTGDNYNLVVDDTVSFLKTFKPNDAAVLRQRQNSSTESPTSVNSNASLADPSQNNSGKKDAQPTNNGKIKTSFYNLRTRKGNSFLSKKWDDYVLYQ